jgi:hypothetical protein
MRRTATGIGEDLGDESTRHPFSRPLYAMLEGVWVLALHLVFVIHDTA